MSEKIDYSMGEKDDSAPLDQQQEKIDLSKLTNAEFEAHKESLFKTIRTRVAEEKSAKLTALESEARARREAESIKQPVSLSEMDNTQFETYQRNFLRSLHG